MPRAGTRSASSEQRAWAVPESLRATLAERYGPVYAGADADRRLLALGTFGACGDRVTARAIELAHPPFVGIVDYKTRRNEAVDPAAFRSLARSSTCPRQEPAGTPHRGAPGRGSRDRGIRRRARRSRGRRGPRLARARRIAPRRGHRYIRYPGCGGLLRPRRRGIQGARAAPHRPNGASENRPWRLRSSRTGRIR